MPNVIKKYEDKPGEPRNKLLKLTAVLERETYISDQTPIHLDELLANVHPAYKSMSKSSRNIPLPLVFITDNDNQSWSDEWVWAASAALYPQARKTSDSLVKSAKEVFFYMIPDSSYSEFSRLLKRIKNLSLDGRGGVIVQWEVERVHGDWTMCCLQDGVAVRNIPQSFCVDSGESYRCSIRPPYWDGSTSKGYLPGTRITLSNKIAFRRKNKYGDFIVVDPENVNADESMLESNNSENNALSNVTTIKSEIDEKLKELIKIALVSDKEKESAMVILSEIKSKIELYEGIL